MPATMEAAIIASQMTPLQGAQWAAKKLWGFPLQMWDLKDALNPTYDYDT